MATIYFDFGTNTYGDATNLTFLRLDTVGKKADEVYHEEFHELGDAEQCSVVDSIPEEVRLEETITFLDHLRAVAATRLAELK